jgi:hypothetical protein
MAVGFRLLSQTGQRAVEVVLESVGFAEKASNTLILAISAAFFCVSPLFWFLVRSES